MRSVWDLTDEQNAQRLAELFRVSMEILWEIEANRTNPDLVAALVRAAFVKFNDINKKYEQGEVENG